MLASQSVASDPFQIEGIYMSGIALALTPHPLVDDNKYYSPDNSIFYRNLSIQLRSI